MINFRYAKSFCDDITKIENYQEALNDKTQTWHCHHKLETDLDLTREQLKEQNKYYNRPANELIFLTPHEHKSLHFKIISARQIGPNKGKPMLEETKQKLRETMTGRKAPWNSRHMSEETKEKLRNLHKVRKMSEEAKQKMREARLKYWKNKHENQ